MPKRTPEFAPLEIPPLLCTGCGNRMRQKIDRYANGKIQGVTYYCDTCEYGFASSMTHHNGQMTKYAPPMPEKTPEPLAKPTEEATAKNAKPPTPPAPTSQSGGGF